MTSINRVFKNARIVKSSVLNHQRLGAGEQWGFVFAEEILNPGKPVPGTHCGVAPSPQGQNWKGNITKEEYTAMAKQLISFVKKNNRMRNFTSFTRNGKTIKLETKVYVYLFARIVRYYEVKHKLPKLMVLDTSVFKQPAKKYGRSTEYGCDNRGQNNGHYCGPHMIQEIIRNLTGKVISQSTLASVIGTTYDGSDHEGLDTSIAWFNKKYGYNLKVEWKNFSDLGWSGIKKILESNNKDCGLHELYRNTWGHYTNFDRIYGDYIEVHNSLGDYCNSGCYCGYTEERDKSEAESYLGGISQKSVMVVTNETN